MSTPFKKSQILEDGLRCRAKVSGSPFGETNQYAHTATMSRFLCGKHRPKTPLMTRKLLGKAQNVCTPKCEK
jgi:hypothetical protein